MAPVASGWALWLACTALAAWLQPGARACQQHSFILSKCLSHALDCGVQVYGQVDHLPPGLLRQLLPGPVTLLLRKQFHAPLCAELNPGVELIGERCVLRLAPPQWLCIDKPRRLEILAPKQSLWCSLTQQQAD